MGLESLVSVIIPTRNEEEALPVALNSVDSQTYRNIEVIVVDSNSTDTTKKIAGDFGARVIDYDGRTLGARYLGVKESKGEYVLFLDADQALESSAIERAVELIKDHDMLMLEESSYNPSTWIQKQLYKEKLIAHEQAIASGLTETMSGLVCLYPRFFRHELLIKVYQNIPKKLFPIVMAGDDGIISEEVYKISKRVGLLRQSVKHIEEKTLIDYIIHCYQFGKSSRVLAKTGLYKNIYTKPPQISQISKLNRAIKTKTILITVIGGLAYRIGYYV